MPVCLTTIPIRKAPMKSILAALFSLVILFALTGCGGGDAATGHRDDTTPGGEATPAADDLMDDAAFDAYSAEQSNPGQNQ